MKVYVVQHEYERDGVDEVKLVGIYRSAMDARSAVERISRLPGFADHPDGFSVDPYEVGLDHWTEGFSIVLPVQRSRGEAA